VNPADLDRLELGRRPAQALGFENVPWPLYRAAHLEFPTNKAARP
jgi:hypothetical protein